MMKWLGIGFGTPGIVIVLFLLFYPLCPILQITAAKTGMPLFCTRMAEGEEFILSFTHSVNKRPVYDTIRIEDDHLLIVKTRFDSFGAGMPETARLGEDGRLELIVNRPVSEITFFVGWVANHTLESRGKKVGFLSLAEPGTLLSLRIQKASRYELWKGRCAQ